MIQNRITLTDIYDRKLIPKLETLKQKVPARLVIDDTIQDYISIIPAISPYVDVVYQVQDSSNDYQISLNQYVSRCKFYLLMGKTGNGVEISNEPNGTGEKWNGPDVLTKMKFGNSFFNQFCPGVRQLVTLYYQPGVVEWWNANKIPGVEVWLSFYPTMLSDFSQIPETLKALNAVGLGECGMEQWETNSMFSRRLDRNIGSVMQAAKNLNVPVNWWDWQSDYQLWNGVFNG